MNPPPEALDWTFPLSRPHTGVPLANGRLGLLVWGGGGTLHLTIARAGFWDRRGGNPFLSNTTYQEVRRLLEAGDGEGLRTLFGRQNASYDQLRPHQIGGGRLELEFPSGFTLEAASLDLARGSIRVEARGSEGSCNIFVRLDPEGDSAWVEFPHGFQFHSVRLRPAWDWVGGELSAGGCAPPEQWDQGTELGFVQNLPEDDSLAVLVRTDPDGLRIAGMVGPDARARAAAALAPHPNKASAERWWTRYWDSVPDVRVPDPVLQEAYEYGLYLQACCTPPKGLACTLQGPLMEETRIPPWSNDYHFNINAQMIYTPALATNRLEHFEPLWELLRGWLPRMKESGSAFFGDPNALMLPHAVDDQCQVVGTFWTGSIDHACTAWMALMCWEVCRTGGDSRLLRDLAWPLLIGSFAGYRAMMEEDGDGNLSLPVSVSPEYKGSRMDAWGRNASFQLAACHAVVRALPRAAEWLGEPIDPRWEEVRCRLPRFCVEDLPVSAEAPESTAARIVLWEGQDLDASHRHHSHLAGITPFKTVDPRDPETRGLLRNSLRAWQYRGPGAWSGWCVPWAASLHAHVDEPEAAVLWLRFWKEVFTNEGRACLHDAAFPGVSTLDGSSAYWEDQAEIMQLDGRFGALTAVLDLLVQEFDGLIRVMPRLPRGWTDLSFSGVLAPGGFLVDATVAGGRVQQVRLTSRLGGRLRVELPGGEIVERDTTPGQVLDLLGSNGASPST